MSVTNHDPVLEVTNRLFTTRDIDSLLDEVINQTSLLLGAERSSLYLLDEETGELWYRVAQDLDIQNLTLPVGKGIAGYVVKTGEPVNLSNVYSDKRFNPEIDKISGFKTRNILCMPLRSLQGKIIGAIQVLNKVEGSFGPEDERILQTLSGTISLCLDNSRVYEEWKRMFISSMTALGRAIDSRSPVRGGHSERVSKLSVKIAEELNLTQDRIDKIRIAALVHDFGKLNLDTGKHENYEQAPDHVTVAREQLGFIDWIPDFLEIPSFVAMHHEHFDGSGFPTGIAGKSIPLEARILSLAESLDNFILSQPGKLTTDQAHQNAAHYLESHRGSLFDPELVTLVVEHKLYQIERRSFQRINQELSISFSLLEGDNLREILNEKQTSRTINISGGGLLFKSPEPLPVGKFLEVNLELPDNVFYVIAKIVRCDQSPFLKDYTIGIQFMNLSHRVQIRLQRHLTDLSHS